VTSLQHALLPGELPQVPGVSAAARYRPGSAIVDVGGDWYDVIVLPGHRVGIVLGDVVGRGVAAAATMGQLRSAVAALAPHSEHPAQVLDRLDDYGATVRGAALATLVYLDYDPATGLLRYSCAGHPPPILVDRHGAVHRLDDARGVPLSALPGVGRPLAQRVVDAPATLICYSDGLIERRGRTIDDSLDGLVAQVSHLHGTTPDEICDELLEALAGDSPFRDDIALLTAELGTTVPAAFRVSLPAEPGQLATLRLRLRRWAAEAGLDDLRTSDLVLATGEACANAVEHAYRTEASGVIEVEVRIANDGEITACVSDSGRWRERREAPRGRGRGLAMIEAVMDGVSVTHGQGGTIVRMRRGAR